MEKGAFCDGTKILEELEKLEKRYGNEEQDTLKIDNPAEIRIRIDCGNCPMQNDEELYFKYELEKLIEWRNMKIVELRIWR